MFGLKTRNLVHTHPTSCVVMQFCARGSMYDVLAKARTSPLLAQQLDWPKRVSMALDAAKASRFTFRCVSTLHATHHYRHSSVSAKGMCSVCQPVRVCILQSTKAVRLGPCLVKFAAMYWLHSSPLLAVHVLHSARPRKCKPFHQC